jgi:hypothetical protein
MQLRLNPRPSKSLVKSKLLVKTILFVLIVFLVIFVLDRIEKPAPNKLIKQEISNDKLITLK